jgi:hypothetical protein
LSATLLVNLDGVRRRVPLYNGLRIICHKKIAEEQKNLSVNIQKSRIMEAKKAGNESRLTLLLPVANGRAGLRSCCFCLLDSKKRKVFQYFLFKMEALDFFIPSLLEHLLHRRADRFSSHLFEAGTSVYEAFRYKKFVTWLSSKLSDPSVC